jgi:O-antigen/teichoic acid export membrane protein
MASIQGSTLIVGAYLGAGTVAVLATTRALVNVAPQVTSAVSAALWPELTMMEAAKRYTELDRLHRLSAKIVLLIALMTAVWLHFAGHDLVTVWTGGRIVYDQRLMDACLLLQVIVAWQLMSSVVLNASNNHKPVAWIRLASSILGLFCGWMLMPWFGVAGCIAGLLIAEMIVGGFTIPMYACRLLRSSARVFFGEVLGRGLVAAAAIHTVAGIAASVLPAVTPISRILALGSTVTGTSAIVMWCIWLNRSERRWLSAFIQRRGTLSTAAANA